MLYRGNNLLSQKRAEQTVKIDCVSFLQTLDKEAYGVKNVTIFSDVDLSEATNLSHITSVIEL